MLTLALAQLQLPAAGLSLVSDAVQLLFYHSPWGPDEAKPGETEAPPVQANPCTGRRCCFAFSLVHESL